MAIATFGIEPFHSNCQLSSLFKTDLFVDRFLSSLARVLVISPNSSICSDAAKNAGRPSTCDGSKASTWRFSNAKTAQRWATDRKSVHALCNALVLFGKPGGWSTNSIDCETIKNALLMLGSSFRSCRWCSQSCRSTTNTSPANRARWIRFSPCSRLSQAGLTTP